MENKNDPVITSSLESDLPEVENQARSPIDSPSDRKFRIQTDWSDTGPNSQPIGANNSGKNLSETTRFKN